MKVLKFKNIKYTPKAKWITKPIPQRIIAVDFDGTIHDVKNPIEGKRMGGVVPGAKEALRMFRYRGYKIVIFCYWAKDENSIKTIMDWMNYWDCKFDDITNIKPMADAYIDDKGIHFYNWPDAIERLNAQLNYDDNKEKGKEKTKK